MFHKLIHAVKLMINLLQKIVRYQQFKVYHVSGSEYMKTKKTDKALLSASVVKL